MDTGVHNFGELHTHDFCPPLRVLMGRVARSPLSPNRPRYLRAFAEQFTNDTRDFARQICFCTDTLRVTKSTREFPLCPKSSPRKQSLTPIVSFSLSSCTVLRFLPTRVCTQLCIHLAVPSVKQKTYSAGRDPTWEGPHPIGTLATRLMCVGTRCWRKCL